MLALFSVCLHGNQSSWANMNKKHVNRLKLSQLYHVTNQSKGFYYLNRLMKNYNVRIIFWVLENQATETNLHKKHEHFHWIVWIMSGDLPMNRSPPSGLFEGKFAMLASFSESLRENQSICANPNLKHASFWKYSELWGVSYQSIGLHNLIRCMEKPQC
jgi:hypothetical protein